MSINYSSELMKNQQHAVVMAPDSQFQVMQTSDGNSLFFSIGTDNVFYCTRELPADTQGWSRTDMSSALSANYKNTAVVAKMFDVSQNLSAGTIDIALVITVNGSDYLYLSLGNSSADTAWANPLSWTPMPYDDPSYTYTSLTIADIYVAQSGSTEYVVADIVANTPGTVKTIYRYYIDPARPQIWVESDVSGNLQAGSITNCLGRIQQPAEFAIDGIYTMGTIVNEQEIIYTPLYNQFGSTLPESTILGMPAGASAMALSVNPQGFTDLFVTANGSLYFLASKAQKVQAMPAVVYTHPLLTNVLSLHVNNANNNVVVWGVNQQGQLFYLKTVSGSETDTASWSYPLPLLTGVESAASFLNNNANNSVIFASVQGNQLVQLTQDPVTTSWQQRNIILPPTDVHDLIENYTYSTRISFTDENNIVQPNTAASITATSPCSVYINNTYCVLSASSPLQITSDALGVINIVQQVDGIAAVCYNVTVNGQTQNINPMVNVIARLQNVTTGINLDVNVTDERGKSTPLVGTGITTDQKNQAAGWIAQLVPYSAAMPQDGSLQTISGSTVSPTAGAIEVVAGDVWQWLKHAAAEVDSFVVKVVGDVTHFLITIGSDIYHFVIRCMSDVAHGIEFVLRQIAIGVDDMVKWIGFIFAWNDIVLTHQVLKNVLLQYINNCVSSIDATIIEINGAFDSLEANINNWAGIPDSADTFGSLSATSSASTAPSTPQANWGLYHTQNNAAAASSPYNAPSSAPSGTVEQALSDLLTMIKQEGAVLENVYTQVKAIIDNLGSLTITDIIKQVIAIITDALLSTVENAITTLLNILSDLLVGLTDALNAKLHIPIISAMYKKYAGDDLSLFDLACLVVAIPVTVVYKIVFQAAPFEDDAVTNSLKSATNFAAIQTICNAPSSPLASAQQSTAAVVAPMNTVLEKLTFAGNIMAAAGGLAMALLVTQKVGQPPLLIAGITGAFYFPYVAPDIIGNISSLNKQRWYANFNASIAGVAVCKAGVDIIFYNSKQGTGVLWQPISPWFDFLINAVWQVPTTAAPFYPENANLNGMLSFAAGTLFDIGGLLSPVIAMKVEPEAGAAVLGTVVCNAGYAALSIVQNFDN